MSFSKKLLANEAYLVSLVKELKKTYKYVSVLGCDHQTIDYFANKNTASSSSSLDNDYGYVVKMTNGRGFYEYAFDHIEKSVEDFAKDIIASCKLDSNLPTIESKIPEDDPLVMEKEDESDLEKFSSSDILNFTKELKDKTLAKDSTLANVIVRLSTLNSSKMFISENRLLKQNYHFNVGFIMSVSLENNKVTPFRVFADGVNIADCVKKLENKIDFLISTNKKLAYAKPIVPGVYDIITSSSITGLIVHEAFGHGVEMDQFVKDRALSKQYMGKRVAAKGVYMHDGAAGQKNVASFFFDDDGVLAQDTLIIKDGILVGGMCDLVSGTQLNYKPTGNGRRQSHLNKVYTRMTNTYFEKGHDKLEDMIKSIKHGYMLFDTNNGMEDPKNWAIQCTCEYGIEIVDGKLTDNYVSPVVMSGFVLDFLNSISMISDDFEINGAGFCGKGYKEWVRVSDGGPAIKARVKLG